MKTLCREKVYTYRKVLEIEAAGFDVIGGLLREFIAVLKPETKKSEKIQKLISEHYVAKQLEKPDQWYEAILQVVQFVSGMTDTYAIDTYRSITGIHLPNY
jgi:dGTPase